MSGTIDDLLQENEGLRESNNRYAADALIHCGRIQELEQQLAKAEKLNFEAIRAMKTVCWYLQEAWDRKE